MGYGFGGFLLVLGLVLALAVRDSVDAVDLTLVGWIMAAVGLVVIVLSALTFNRARRARTTETVTNSDGTQSVRDTRSSGM
jgi:membrane protein implicated in regulation of membrane protease activity